MSEIQVRMERAAQKLRDGPYLNPRARMPRAFFLTEEDYAEFVATGPAYEQFPFHQGGRATSLSCPSFYGYPVRKTLAKVKPTSKLYSVVGTSVGIK